MLPKIVTKRKLICHHDKSLKLVYLLMLYNHFLYNVFFLTTYIIVLSANMILFIFKHLLRVLCEEIGIMK